MPKDNISPFPGTPLERARHQIVTALRAAEEGSLDLCTVDTIIVSLTSALRLLSLHEDETAKQGAASKGLSPVSPKRMQ